MITSAFLRSGCCDAPVIQNIEDGLPVMFPVLCMRCRQELGAPSVDEVEDGHGRVFRWRTLGYMIQLRAQWRTAAGSLPRNLFKITGV